MSRRCRISLQGLALLCLLPASGWAAEPLRVFVSVLPQQTLVEAVGGDHVRVEALVRAGYSPATYSPTPRQIASLNQADVYVLAGVPFEDAWLPRILAVNPDLVLLNSRPGSSPPDTDDHGHGDDPHTWTSPALALVMAARVRDGLQALLPDAGEDFDAGYQTLAAELQTLDVEIRATLEPLRDRRFLVYHPAWGHFADAYGLTQLAIEHEGKEPGPRTLASLIDRARQAGIGVVFVQPQFHSKMAQRVAESIGARVEVVDPLDPDIGVSLRRLARAIARDHS